jgi:hypothetical protein
MSLYIPTRRPTLIRVWRANGTQLTSSWHLNHAPVINLDHKVVAPAPARSLVPHTEPPPRSGSVSISTH